MQAAFAWLTFALWLMTYALYDVAVVRRKVFPSFGFWLTVAIIDWATILSLYADGVTGTALTLPLCWVTGATTTFAFAWFQHGVFRLKRLELVCLVTAVLGLVAWKLSGDPQVSLVIQAMTMTAASWPFFANALAGNESWKLGVIPMAAALASLGMVGNGPEVAWTAWVMPIVAVALNATSLVCAIIGRDRRQPDVEVPASVARNDRALERQ